MNAMDNLDSSHSDGSAIGWGVTAIGLTNPSDSLAFLGGILG